MLILLVLTGGGRGGGSSGRSSNSGYDVRGLRLGSRQLLPVLLPTEALDLGLLFGREHVGLEPGVDTREGELLEPRDAAGAYLSSEEIHYIKGEEGKVFWLAGCSGLTK